METHKHERATIQDVELKAQELLHIMLELCEARLLAAEKRDSLTAAAMAEALLAVKAGIRTFIFIERLPDK